MIGNVFDEMGTYWAQIAQQHYTEKQVHFLKTILNKNAAILDLACGTARHLNSLTENGFEVVGLDTSAGLLKIAKTQNPNAQLVRGDMRSLPFKKGCFGAVVNMDTSVGYLPSAQDDLQVLREANRILASGGLLVVDIFNKLQIAQKYAVPKQEMWEYPSFYLTQQRVLDLDEVMEDFWVTKDKANGEIRSFVHRVRLYGVGELQGLLGSAGFLVEEVFGDYDCSVFSVESKRLILIAYSR
ncbi:MAG: class I SAM-dependent methyltransferase [Candidatus Bathyarchaeota archaeon]|nr:class I SAM-dependent methyltransferase [Candidatus Bathyarchaeota archaeon]